MMKGITVTPFDFVKSINSKTPLEDMTGYVSWVVNRAFSMFSDTVLYANEINISGASDPRWQYNYLFHSIRKKNRYTAWVKDNADEDLKMIAEYFDMSIAKARAAMPLLDRSLIKKIRNAGGGPDDVASR